MMGFTTRHIRKHVSTTEVRIKVFTLLLCACILPIRTVRIRKATFMLTTQLVHQASPLWT